jgi:hypothetical protein
VFDPGCIISSSLLFLCFKVQLFCLLVFSVAPGPNPVSSRDQDGEGRSGSSPYLTPLPSEKARSTAFYPFLTVHHHHPLPAMVKARIGLLCILSSVAAAFDQQIFSAESAETASGVLRRFNVTQAQRSAVLEITQVRQLNLCTFVETFVFFLSPSPIESRLGRVACW